MKIVKWVPQVILALVISACIYLMAWTVVVDRPVQVTTRSADKPVAERADIPADAKNEYVYGTLDFPFSRIMIVGGDCSKPGEPGTPKIFVNGKNEIILGGIDEKEAIKLLVKAATNYDKRFDPCKAKVVLWKEETEKGKGK